jgi:hypothetical protein
MATRLLTEEEWAASPHRAGGPPPPALARRGTQAEQVLRLQRAAGNRATGALLRRRAAPRRTLQRVVELRPPGRGEASAFDRVQELVDRINQQSDRVRYRLNGRRLEYQDIDPRDVILNPFVPRSPNFDTKMKEYIDRNEVVPMRLITNEGLVGGQRLLIDSLQLAYVDLDDMLACSDLSFQLNLLHFLEERFDVRDYERRIGTNMGADFPRAHRRGLRAEAEHLRTVVGDPSIEFLYEEVRPNGRIVFGFISRAEGYRIFHVFRPGRRGVQGGDLFVRTRDGRRISIEDLIAERQAAAAPAAAP